jgi:predicted DNA-binding transcriptional regulator YafY
MNTGTHDPLVYRLAQILVKLNSGEKLEAQALADAFGVNLRTIQRDLNERLAYLPLVKHEGRYQLESAFLGRLSLKDIERFASLAGLSGLFPALDTGFLRELFDYRLRDALLIHGHNYEDASQYAQTFTRLQRAIQERRALRFDYAKPEERKTVAANPYKLINHDGVWYLAATDAGQIKAYALGKISALRVSEESYEPEARILELLDGEDSIWLNEKKTEAVLAVAPFAAPYFQRQQLIARQVIEKTLEDAGLLVSGKFAHPKQILPIVRYWLPHVRIVSPESWQEEMEAGLKAYLEH